MSLTVNIAGKNNKWERQVLVKPVHIALSVCTAVLVTALLISSSLSNLEGLQTRIQENKRSNSRELQQLDALKTATDDQLQILAARVGSLHAQVARLEALGTRLAADNQLAKQFDFSAASPVGGPNAISSSESRYTPEDLVALLEQMDQLTVQLNDRSRQLELLEALLLNQELDAQSYISGRPIGRGWLSSYYGMRNDPFTGKPAMHKGVDFAGKEGADVIATGAGIVTWAGKRYGYGELIEINHGGGYVTRYGHNKTLLVNEGDVISKGQVIAMMGSTGRSTGPHVHYEVLKHGKQINPIKFVYRKAKQ